MTKLLRFTPAARADLARIWNYAAQHWDTEQADRYLEEVHGVCLALATGEMISRPVDLRPGTRKARAGSHVVYVRQGADRLDVIRILHHRAPAPRRGTAPLKGPHLTLFCVQGPARI